MGDSLARGRPTVWVNCAVSADGRLAYAGGRRALLSGPQDLRRVQQLRADSDAILVGVGTVILDDPSLRVHRELLGRPAGKTPYRVILDSRGRIPPTSRVLDGSVPTIILTTDTNLRRYPTGVETIATSGSQVNLAEGLSLLLDRGIRRVLVEGGSLVLSSVLRAPLWDRLTVFVAPVLIGGSTAPTFLTGPETPDEASATRIVRDEYVPLDDGVLLGFRPSHDRPGPRATT
ncbi:MAG: dihydrofolate reductase family protein [Thermoplasmata archaeon]